MIKNKLRYGEIIAESFYPAEGRKDVAIIFCSGLPGKSSYEEVAQLFVQEGFIFIHPKYVGSWESYGNFTMSSCKKTITSLVRGLRENKVKTVFGGEFELSPKRIILLGHSFGGSIALSAGAEADVEGIVALAPVLDYTTHAKDPAKKEEELTGLFAFLKNGFENVYRGLTNEDWTAFCNTGLDLNPVNYVNKLKGKTVLLMHGKNDTSVSPEKTKQFFAKVAFTSPLSRHVETEDTHSSIKTSTIPEIVSWIEKIIS